MLNNYLKKGICFLFICIFFSFNSMAMNADSEQIDKDQTHTITPKKPSLQKREVDKILQNLSIMRGYQLPLGKLSGCTACDEKAREH